MSTIGRRLAVLATLVALMAAPIVTAAAAPAGADQFASIAISTSPSGDVPVGQAMTLTVDWGLDFPPPNGPLPVGFGFTIPASFRVDSAVGPCVMRPSGSATNIDCDYPDVVNAPAEFNFAVTAVSESYDATFAATPRSSRRPTR
jgi:hypothetical protein